MNDYTMKINLNEILREVNYQINQNYYLDKWLLEKDIEDKSLLIIHVRRNKDMELSNNWEIDKSKIYEDYIPFWEIGYFVAQKFALTHEFNLNDDVGLQLEIPIYSYNEISFSNVKMKMLNSIYEYFMLKLEKNYGYQVVSEKYISDGKEKYTFQVVKI